MKGIVFTEFLEMIEDAYGYELVDKLLVESRLPSGGIYTSVGTYDHTEMVTLVQKLGQHLDMPVADLLRNYGRYMFRSFKRHYGHFIDRCDTAFELLNSVQHYIHVEVRKLYPDAELPHFTITQHSETHLTMHYQSERKLGDFAQGLIEGCLAHYRERATVTQIRRESDGGDVVFEILKN
jgi:hypothetical protein